LQIQQPGVAVLGLLRNGYKIFAKRPENKGFWPVSEGPSQNADTETGSFSAALAKRGGFAEKWQNEGRIPLSDRSELAIVGKSIGMELSQ